MHRVDAGIRGAGTGMEPGGGAMESPQGRRKKMLATKKKAEGRESSKKAETRSRAPTAELLDIYLKESGAYPVLPPK